MSSLAKQDQSARKFWGDRLIKGAWTDSEIRVLEKHPDLSDYNLGMKLRRTPSSVRAKRSQLASELDPTTVVTKRLRESRKAKHMEKLHSERVDAYVKKVIESAPPISLEKREPVERVFNDGPQNSPSGELIPLTENDGIQAVMGRDLHEFLMIGRDYTTWFNYMTGYGFTEGEDYITQGGISAGQGFTPKVGKTHTPPKVGRPALDHVLSLDMAKEISMIQRTDKGKQARQYFIECERRAKRAPAELTRLELLQIAMESEKERLALEDKVTELEPKAIHYNRFMDAEGTYTWDEVVRIIGVGKNKMLESLRIQKVLMTGGNRQNLPYQSHMHRFEVKEKTWTNPATGFEHISYDVRLKPEHIDFIAKKCEHLLNPPA